MTWLFQLHAAYVMEQPRAGELLQSVPDTDVPLSYRRHVLMTAACAAP